MYFWQVNWRNLCEVEAKQKVWTQITSMKGNYAKGSEAEIFLLDLVFHLFCFILIFLFIYVFF